MDVEYILLETNDDFLTHGLVQDVGKDIIIIRNRNDSGDIFIFDRSGKAVKKINRKGGGGEEYTGFSWVRLDEDNGEIFVNDAHPRRIAVYDLDGNFKRRFQHREGAKYDYVSNFDRGNLICHDELNDHTNKFMIISKQDGSMTGEIQIPSFEERKSIVIHAPGMVHYAPSTAHLLAPYFDNWILVELSADTVYSYSPGHRVTPLVARTPSVRSMIPEVFLFLDLLTDRYYFMETITKDLATGEFPGTDLMYDRQEKAIFRYTVYNGDYSNREKAFLKSMPLNNEIPSTQYLEAHELVSSYRKGQLKGRLKDVAAELDEEDNPVIMLIKHKKQIK
jgi:hypothetical protein